MSRASALLCPSEMRAFVCSGNGNLRDDYDVERNDGF